VGYKNRVDGWRKAVEIQSHLIRFVGLAVLLFSDNAIDHRAPKSPLSVYPHPRITKTREKGTRPKKKEDRKGTSRKKNNNGFFCVMIIEIIIVP